MVMPYQDIWRSITGRMPMISTDSRLAFTDESLKKLIQPASMDFRLGFKAYGVRSAALPHGKRVSDMVGDPRHCWCEFDLGLDKTNPIPLDQTYLIPLAEGLALPSDVEVEFSPKSSLGRVDAFGRVICDNHSGYDKVPAGYHGPLWLEITSLSHEIGIGAGIPLVQARFKKVGEPKLTSKEIESYHCAEGIALDFAGEPIPTNRLDIRNGALTLHVDLNREVVGFVARDTATSTLDLTKENVHEPLEFWEPIMGTKDKELILMPGKFYLLATEERIAIPPGICGHLIPTVATMGETRLHYAGFFDNGFGGKTGTHGVLEVRGRDVRFKIEHGKPVGAMEFERTSTVPTKLYGVGNSYANDHKPSLSKHFKHRYEAWTADYWRSAH